VCLSLFALESFEKLSIVKSLGNVVITTLRSSKLIECYALNKVVPI